MKPLKTAVYQINEARFVLPDEWRDRSVNIFLKGGDTPGEFSFVISREEIEKDEFLSDYASRQLEQLTQNLCRFQLIRRLDTIVDDLPAVEAEFLWVSEGGPMHQHQFYLFVGRAALTLTGAALESAYARYERVLQQIVLSFERGR